MGDFSVDETVATLGLSLFTVYEILPAVYIKLSLTFPSFLLVDMVLVLCSGLQCPKCQKLGVMASISGRC